MRDGSNAMNSTGVGPKSIRCMDEWLKWYGFDSGQFEQHKVGDGWFRNHGFGNGWFRKKKI